MSHALVLSAAPPLYDELNRALLNSYLAHPIPMAPPPAILPFPFPTSVREISPSSFPHLPTPTDGPLPPVCAIPGRLDGTLAILLFAVPARLPDPEMQASVTTHDALPEPELPMLHVTAAPSPWFPSSLQQVLSIAFPLSIRE